MLTKEDKSSLFMLIAAVVALLLIVIVPKAKAEGGELTGAREALAFGSSFVDTFTVETPSTNRANALPDAYMFFSKQLELFYVQRWFGPTKSDEESVPIPIPAGTSIIIPAPPAQRIDGLWRHVFFLNATTVTDTVFVIPMDR